jgi:hypothetical protein
LLIGRHNSEAHAAAVSSGHKRLENLLGGHAYFRCNTLCRKVIRVDGILADAVADTDGIEKAGGVGFHWVKL